MTAANPKFNGPSDYTTWLTNVHSLLAHHRPDVDPTRLDPNETFQAHWSGASPSEFALQPVLPLRITPPLTPRRAAGAAYDAGRSLGQAPESRLVAWLWGLTALNFVLYLCGAGPLVLALDVPPFIIALVLVTRQGPSAVHGWVKLALELVGAVLAFEAARGRY